MMRLFRSKDKDEIKNFVVCVFAGREGDGYTAILNSDYQSDPYLKTMTHRIVDHLNNNYPLENE